VLLLCQLLLGPVTRTIDRRPITSPVRFFNGSDLGFAPPFARSSNTGYERVDTEVVMLVQDTTGAVSLVLLHDAPCDPVFNTFCPITSSGYSAGCGGSCDADGALLTWRVAMRKLCSVNGTACAQRMGAQNEFVTASPRDLTPWTGAGELAFTSSTYFGGVAAPTCCPNRGFAGAYTTDWYSNPFTRFSARC
jgi:hypothetical protein